MKKIFNFIGNKISYFLSIILKRYVMSGFPCFLGVEISSVCNLHCKECPVGNGSMVNRKNKYLSLDKFEDICEQFEGRVLNVILYFQGEPFLNPEFIDIIKCTKSRNIYTQTSTNGQLIDEEVARNIVLSGLDRIVISIDGINQESYEKYREGGKLDKCIDAIKFIDRYKKEYGVKRPIIESQMIVFSHNENEIDGFRVLSKEWGADVVSIKTAQIYDYECNSSLIPKTGKYSRYKYVGEKWEMKKKVRNRCWRAWNGAVINSDGEMLPCCFDKNSAYSYGNVFEEDICVLWNNERAREFRKQILKDRSSVEMCCNCDV